MSPSSVPILERAQAKALVSKQANDSNYVSRSKGIKLPLDMTLLPCINGSCLIGIQQKQLHMTDYFNWDPILSLNLQVNLKPYMTFIPPVTYFLFWYSSKTLLLQLQIAQAMISSGGYDGCIQLIPDFGGQMAMW